MKSFDDTRKKGKIPEKAIILHHVPLSMKTTEIIYTTRAQRILSMSHFFRNLLENELYPNKRDWENLSNLVLIYFIGNLRLKLRWGQG